VEVEVCQLTAVPLLASWGLTQILEYKQVSNAMARLCLVKSRTDKHVTELFFDCGTSGLRLRCGCHYSRAVCFG
jgi:hypothetical protein